MYEKDKKVLESVLRLREKNPICNFAFAGELLKPLSTACDVGDPFVFINGHGGISSSSVSCKDVEKLKNFAESLVSPCVETKAKQTWHIDGSYVDQLKSPIFHGPILPNLASSFVSSLMCSEAKFSEMELQLENVLLYGCGGPFKHPQRDVKPLVESHVFGRMLLHVPVKNGYEGGKLKVTGQTGNSKCFDFSQNSQHLHYAAFLANCHYEFEPITMGWMLTMTFNLSWKNALWMPPITSLVVFFRALTVAEEIVGCWANGNKEESGEIVIHSDDDDEEIVCLTDISSSSNSAVTNAAIIRPSSSDETAISGSQQVEDFLFFPLDHKFTRENLCFSDLLGRDRLLNGVFQSINYIDIYLALIDEVSNGRYLKIKHAVSADGCLPRKEFHLDTKSQLIGEIRHVMEHVNRQPSEKESQVHKHAILIVQSRLQSVKIACFNNFDGMLDHLEITLSSFISSQCRLIRRNLIGTLEQVLSFCEANPLRAWKDSTSTTQRLFNICRNLRSKETGLTLLDLMCTDFTLNANGKVMARNQVTLEKVCVIPTNKDHRRQQLDADSDTETCESDSETETCESEDDDSLCSSCSEPLRELNAISCDRCRMWYHKCGGSTREMRKELECKGLEWICPKCVSIEYSTNAGPQQDRQSNRTTCKEGTTSIPKQTESTLFYEGVRDEEVAIAVVDFLCEVNGWTDCANSILKLFAPTRLSEQLASLISLIRQLLLRSSLQGAAHTANRLSHLLTLYDKPSKLIYLQVIAYLDLMMDLEENTITANEERMLAVVAFVKKLKTFQKCQLIIDLQERDKIRTTPAYQKIYHMLRNFLLKCKFDDSRRVATMVPRLINCLQSLEDASFLHFFIEKLCFNQSSIELLQPLLSSPNIWKQTVILDMIQSFHLGRMTLISVVNSLISQLKRRDHLEDNFMQDLISCVFLAFYIILENFEMPANSKTLNSLSDLYSKLCNNNLFQLVQGIVQIIQKNPFKKPSFPPFMELCQELLKRNESSKSASLFGEVAQVFQRQDRAQFHQLVNLLVKFDFVSPSSDLSIFHKILTLMDISTPEADPEWSKSYVLLLETWIANIHLSNCRSGIADCVLMFIRTEEHRANLKCDPMDSCVTLFHAMFGYMSTLQLGQLIADIHQSESHRLKDLPFSFRMFQSMCFLFADRDLKFLIQSGDCDVLIPVMIAIFWLDTNSSIVDSICVKICSDFPFGSDIPAVKQILFSTEIQNFVISSGSNVKNAFCLLLDQRICYLRFCVKLEYSWAQPNAIFADCDKVQKFLRSPLERITYYSDRKQTNSENIVEKLKEAGCSVLILLSNQTQQTLLIIKNKFSKQLPDSQHYAQKAELDELINLRRMLLESSEKSEMDTSADALKSILSEICCRLNNNEVTSSAANGCLVDQDIANCVQTYVIQNEDEFFHPLSYSIELFSPLFEKMSAWRLARLLVKIHQQSKSSGPSGAKESLATLNFYAHIAQLFVKKYMNDLLKSGDDIIVDVMASLLWLGGSQSAVPFSRVICDSFPPEQENPVVTKMVTSSKLREIALDCRDGRKVFCLLDQHITRLNQMKASVSDKNRDDVLKTENQQEEEDTMLLSLNLQRKSESEGFSGGLMSVDDSNKVESATKRCRLDSF